MGVIDILHFLLTTSPNASIHSLEEWQQNYPQQVSSWQLPIERALAGGFFSDRLGFAFASGYSAALGALVPSLSAGNPILAFCITEEGGAHPRSLKTRLSPEGEGRFLMSGKKLWGTLAPRAQKLLVAASLGEDDTGQNRLKIALLEASRPGITVGTPLEAPFVPEIPHAEILFERVEVREEDLLPGDGYKQYIKPFRTVEDIHVHAALLGYLVRVVRQYDWPLSFLERACALIAALRALALSPAP